MYERVMGRLDLSYNKIGYHFTTNEWMDAIIIKLYSYI